MDADVRTELEELRSRVVALEQEVARLRQGRGGPVPVEPPPGDPGGHPGPPPGTYPSM